MIIKAILFLLLIIIAETYIVKRITKAFRLIFNINNFTKFKRIRRLLLFYFNLYPIIMIILIITFLFSGNKEFTNPANGLFDWLIVYPFWVSLVILLQSAVLVLLVDLITLVFKLFSFNKEKLLKMEYKIILIIFTFFLFYVPAQVIYDYNTTKVSHITYEKNNLPNSLKGFKIALIADIQADYYTDAHRLEKYIKKVQNEKPDLILIAGDMITSSPNYIKLAGKELGKLSAPYGVFACVGDHDNWAYRRDMPRSLREVKASLQHNGIPMLDNQNVIIPVDSSKIFLTAITNTYVSQVSDTILDSLTNYNSGSDLKIFFVHQPRERLVNKAVKQNYDLYLCGHTHGGQIVMLFPFTNIMMSRLENRFTRGKYFVNKMMIYVNRGLGMSIAPIRYNAEPEITIIKLN